MEYSSQKMDPFKLYHYAESKCHSLSNKVSECMKQNSDNTTRCKEQLADMQDCIEREKKLVLENENHHIRNDSIRN